MRTLYYVLYTSFYQGTEAESITFHESDETSSYAVWVHDFKLPAGAKIPDLNTHLVLYDHKNHTVVRPGDTVEEEGRKDAYK